MSSVSGYGEDRLVAALLGALPPGVLVAPDVLVGAGDDCAVVLPPDAPDACLLLKTDCVIEGVHYLPGTDPGRVGWKALCRVVSDVAAMGGTPRHALITLALPGDATVEGARGLYAGIGRAAERFGVQVVGGETARSPGAGFVSVALTGVVARDRVVRRGGGRVGDTVYVTGRLGGSFLSGKHLDFEPRLAQGQWLAANGLATAMMDLSDGLGADLPRLAVASGTGYQLEKARVPCTPDCSVEQALADGEDYELLLTVAPADCAKLEDGWRARWPGLGLTCVGALTETTKHGSDPAKGYDHFRS